MEKFMSFKSRETMQSNARWLLRLTVFVFSFCLNLVITPAYADTLSAAGEKCLQDAQLNEQEANRFANDVRDPSKWFDLAMENYLCAVDAGSPFAKWKVVNLSGSGQVKALPAEVTDRLLREAAEAGLEEAQLGLASDLCDYTNGALCKHPLEAEYWLSKVAASKNLINAADAVYFLGLLFERATGSSQIENLNKSFACYHLAVERYQLLVERAAISKEVRSLNNWLKNSKLGVERVEKKLNTVSGLVGCY